MESGQIGALANLLFSIGLQVPLALMVYGWGKRMMPPRKAQALLCLIPGVGWLYFWWFSYRTIAVLLDTAGNSDPL